MVDRLASLLPAFRADNSYSPRVRLSVYAPEPMVVAEVTSVPPDTKFFINVTIVSGDEGDIPPCARIAIYSPTGIFKGSTRAPAYTAHTPTVIDVRELMSAQINVEVGDIVNVYPFIPLDTKLVTATASFSPELTYTDQNSNPKPLVCSGGHTAGWVDGYYSASPSTFRTLATDGSNTRTVDPDSGGTVTHAWAALVTAGAALQTGSSSSDASPLFELDTGLHLIAHTAEDDDNSKVGAQYTAHIVHDDTFLPIDVLLTTPPEGDENGWSWSVGLYDALDLEDCPDGSLCILWQDVWTDGDEGVEHSIETLGIGYARRDTSTGSADEGESLTLEIQSPLARLAEICSYSKVMEENGTPDDWGEIKTLGVERAIIQDWMYYTSGTEAGYDLVIHSLFSDARYPAFYLNRSDVVTQIRELVDSRRGRFVQRGRGAIFEVQPRLDLLEWSERASLTVTITLTDDDVYGYEYTREHFDAIEMLEARGITAGTSGNTDLYSRSPIGGGAQAQAQEKCIPDSQTALNIECGLRWAVLNNLFYDADNDYQMHRVGELTLRLPGVYRFWDFECEYIRFQYAGSLRGIDFADTRFWLRRVTTEVDADTGEWITVLVLQAETYGLPGATFVYPPSGTGISDGQQPPWSFPPIVPITPSGVVISGGTGKLLTIDTSNSLFYTLTANGASPTWVEVALSLTGTVCDFVPNAFSPLYLGTGTTVELYVATTTRIYLVEFDTSDYSVDETELATLSSASFTLRRIETERADEGFVVVVTVYSGGATEAVVSTDGATFGSPVTISGSGGGTYGTPGLYVSGRATGKVFTSTNTTGAASDGRVSTNSAATFSALASPNIDSDGSAFSLHVPYADNSAETRAYFGGWAGTGQPRTIKRANGSGAATNISPTDGGGSWGAQLVRSIDTCPINRMRLAACLRNGDQPAGADTVRVYYSLNGGDTWGYISALDGTAGVGAYWGIRSSDDPNIFWTFGEAGRIAKCNFSGQYQNLNGNLTTLGAGWLTNIAGF